MFWCEESKEVRARGSGVAECGFWRGRGRNAAITLSPASTCLPLSSAYSTPQSSPPTSTPATPHSSAELCNFNQLTEVTDSKLILPVNTRHVLRTTIVINQFTAVTTFRIIICAVVRENKVIVQKIDLWLFWGTMNSKKWCSENVISVWMSVAQL